MLALASANMGLMVAPVARPVTVRAAAPQMFDVSPWDDVWGMEAKTACFEAWDPESPRTYDNFNPFERNDEGSMSDFNGCFPGQSRGYKSPKRPDQSWAIMQAEKAAMEELATNPKFSVTGKPGCWTRKWQDNLGSPP